MAAVAGDRCHTLPVPWAIFCGPYRAKSRYPCGTPTPPCVQHEMWDVLSSPGGEGRGLPF